MKDCGEYQREISLLIDGELSEPQKTGLLRHIGQCRECRRVYDAFNAISLSLSAEEAPTSLKADVMSAIKDLNVSPMPTAGQQKPKKFRASRIIALAACLALVIAAAAAVPHLGGRAAAPSEGSSPAAFGMMGEAGEGSGEISDREAEAAEDAPAAGSDALPEVNNALPEEGAVGPESALFETGDEASGGGETDAMNTSRPCLRASEVTAAEVYEDGELMSSLDGAEAPELASILKYAGPYGGAEPDVDGYSVNFSSDEGEIVVEVFIVGGGLACLCEGEAYTAEGSAADFLSAVGG